MSEAQALFEQASASDGRCVGAHYGLGLLALTRGELTAARDAFHRVLDLESGHANSLFHLGLIAEAEKAQDQARYLHGQALRAHPGHAHARRRLDKLDSRPKQPREIASEPPASARPDEMTGQVEQLRERLEYDSQRRPVLIVGFRLRINSAGRDSILPVEMRGLSMRGALANGDDVAQPVGWRDQDVRSSACAT